MITLQFQDGKFQADFGAIIAKAKDPRGMLDISGRVVSEALRRHFAKKEASNPNKLSDRRSHFWLQVRQSVNNPFLGYDNKGRPKFQYGENEKPPGEISGNSVVITITHPAFAQKLFGGTITAKAAEALTIPVEERAYDRTAATFERETGLKLILLKIGGSTANALENAVLAVADPNDPKRLTVEYALMKSVNQQADKEALPPKAQLEAAIISRAQRVLDRENQNPTTTTE